MVPRAWRRRGDGGMKARRFLSSVLVGAMLAAMMAMALITPAGCDGARPGGDVEALLLLEISWWLARLKGHKWLVKRKRGRGGGHRGRPPS